MLPPSPFSCCVGDDFKVTGEERGDVVSTGDEGRELGDTLSTGSGGGRRDVEVWIWMRSVSICCSISEVPSISRSISSTHPLDHSSTTSAEDLAALNPSLPTPQDGLESTVGDHSDPQVRLALLEGHSHEISVQEGAQRDDARRVAANKMHGRMQMRRREGLVGEILRC